MPRLLFDFPDAAGRPRRVVLTDPVGIVETRTPDAVPAALEHVERAVEGGLTAAGYLSYEAAPAFEPRMRVRAGSRMPLLWFGLFDEEAASTAGRAAASGPAAAPRPTPVPAVDWTLDLGRAAHAAAVARVRAAIAAGISYQVNLTARLRAPFTGDAEALYERMRRVQRSGYHAFLDLGRFAIASASPELFFRTRGARIETRPMKGTRPRGRWPEEDATLRAALAGSAKDRAENLMIVDLLRNDLGRVAATGSVTAQRFFAIEGYPTVWQATSTIAATLRPGVRLGDILAALFPCGSVTGAPKISTMELIAALERAPREVYCGAIGILRPGGERTFAVPIRTAWIDRDAGVAEYGAGGGVVWDSGADAEYDELLAKAVVVREPWPELGLVETLRLEHGVFVRLERHLRRLRGSADRLGFDLDEAALASALDDVRARHPLGTRRVRLELEAAGRVRADVAPLEADDDATPRPVALSGACVSSADPLRYHKTTHRCALEGALAAAPGAWDVVLRNERDELTELTRGNLVVELGGELLTPPLAAGLLPGCYRAELLEGGRIREASLRPADLARASRAWSINSLRGWTPIRVVRGVAAGRSSRVASA